MAAPLHPPPPSILSLLLTAQLLSSSKVGLHPLLLTYGSSGSPRVPCGSSCPPVAGGPIDPRGECCEKAGSVFTPLFPFPLWEQEVSWPTRNKALRWVLLSRMFHF